MNWEVVGGGALRFRGKWAQMVKEAIMGDDDYTFVHPFLGALDVYPKDVEARDSLIGLVDSA